MSADGVVVRQVGAIRHLLTSLRVVRAVLRSPALRRVELAFLLFNAVEFGTWVAVLVYAYDTTGRASVGLVALAQLLPAAVLAAFAASLADRFPRRRVLLGGYLAQALAFGATAAGMLLGAPPVVVYIAAAAATSSLTITRPCQGSLLPSLARTPEELAAANGLSGTVEGIGVLLGPLTAAGILTVATPGTVFAAGSLACLVAALLVARLPRPGAVIAPAADAPEEHHGHGSVLAGLRVLATEGETRLVVAILGLRMITSGAMDILFVLLAIEVLGTGLSGAGVLSGSLGLGTVLGGAVTFALVGRRRLAPTLALSAATLGVALFVLGVATPSWGVPAVIALGGIGYAACDVAGRMILQRATPDDVLARVLGGLEGIGLAGLAIGSVLVPVLVAILGIQGTFVVASLILPIGVAASWAGLSRIDRRANVPVRELDLLRRTRIFAMLPPPQLESVARRARWITVELGEVVIREGDVGDRYYVMESGRMRVSHDDTELRIVSSPGDGFGEIALLRDVRRTATVTAFAECVLLALERVDFLEAVTGHEQAHRVVQEVVRERSG